MTAGRACGVSRGPAKPDLVEEVLEPDLPIVDAHHHLWDESVPMMREEYLLDDLAADVSSGHNIEATVFVEAEARHRSDGPPELRSVGETEFANAVGEEAARRGMTTRVAAAIVAHADVGLGPAVEAVLDAHQAAAPHRLRGIRDMTVTLDRANVAGDPHLLLQPEYREGLRRLAARGMTYDVYVFQVQLADVIATVRALPEVTFVLNHLGGLVGIRPWTGRRDELFPQWKEDIATIAREPNVYLKLGGMNMFIAGFNWHKGERRPSSRQLVDATGKYFDHAIQSFGPDRCMFESNFSPDKLSGSYRTLWNSFKIIAADYSAEEKASMFAGTARSVYRL
ncbi:amidohydrolase family protein [Geodermatophilus sp. CPCC 205506]|uniref:amidohydrolase family protein n=1 Tax=Geodermatophilus sp. CPCC 205506 TaxID=2936596 RepID=UPI003EEDB5B1